MAKIVNEILNAIEDARKAEGKVINIGSLKYTVRYMDGICYLLIDENEVLSSVDGKYYNSTIAESFLVIIKNDK